MLRAYHYLFWGGTHFRNSGFTDSPPGDFPDNAFHDNGLAGDYRNLIRSPNAYLGAGPVDLGFHHVAAEPAEAEIAVSGAALSASSTYNSQWIPAKARDGLLNDPGWHNAGASALGYQRPVEFLRADLGTSRPVGGVAYAPREMSPSWTDGTWNGVYRRWEIYVTDSASADPADWGVPVAAGEWYWPNRQERKEVRFSAKSGRYVIWRRVEAWGWYTRQVGQTWPGFANANEVGVYPPPPAALTPVDTESDGLADWVEDANGDGLVGPNETDPNNRDTDRDGWNDAEEYWRMTNPSDADTDHHGVRDPEKFHKALTPSTRTLAAMAGLTGPNWLGMSYCSHTVTASLPTVTSPRRCEIPTSPTPP